MVKLANRRIVISTGETVKQKTDAPLALIQNKATAPVATLVQHKVTAVPVPTQNKVAAVPAALDAPVAPAPEVEIIEAYCVSMRRALRRYYGIEAE